ncbi:hypothetical protein Tsubulata_012993, partial [Turnera subulata]
FGFASVMESFTGLKCRKSAALKPIETKRNGKGEMEDDEVDEIAEEEEPLSPSARLFHEPNFNVYIIAILGCKTRINPDILKANLPHTLLKHPRFSSLQVVDEKNHKEMRWVRTRVDLDKHVIVPELDQGMGSPDKFVEDYISNLTKTSIDSSQPLWDLHVLNVRITDAEAVGVFRIHHSLGDGTSLMSLLLACFRQISDPEALPTIPGGKKREMKKPETTDSGWIWRYPAAVWWHLRMFWNTVVDVFMFFVTAIFLKDTNTPIKGPPGVEFAPRRFVWRTVSLDDMKLVKNAMNTTINDVALGVSQAGLSKYLNRKYGEGNLPKNIRLRSTLLVNIRPVSGIQALADMMQKDAEAKWGNWIGFVLLPFTIGIRNDPLDYVREARATVDRKKCSLEAFYTFFIAEMFVKLFGVKISSAITHRVINHTTMCFSNLVGPQEEIGYYGHPMAFIAPSSYNQPHALMINFQSYDNKMTIVLSVDEGTIPDPHQLCDDIVESLTTIKDAVVSRGLANNCT